MDVDAKAEIRRLICQLCAGGYGVLLISSDLDKAFGLSHGLLLIRQGRILREVNPAAASRDEILSSLLGA